MDSARKAKKNSRKYAQNTQKDCDLIYRSTSRGDQGCAVTTLNTRGTAKYISNQPTTTLWVGICKQMAGEAEHKKEVVEEEKKEKKTPSTKSSECTDNVNGS